MDQRTNGPTDQRTNGRAYPLVEMRGCISKYYYFSVKKSALNNCGPHNGIVQCPNHIFIYSSSLTTCKYSPTIHYFHVTSAESLTQEKSRRSRFNNSTNNNNSSKNNNIQHCHCSSSPGLLIIAASPNHRVTSESSPRL